MSDTIKMRGWAEWVLRDAKGNVKPLWQENRLGKWLRQTFGWSLKDLRLLGQWTPCLKLPNSITTLGHAMANGRMSNQGSYGVCTALALGTGSGGSTSLNSEITTGGGARVTAGTISQVTTTNANDTTSLVNTWTFSGGFAITEEGIFDSTTISGSHMLAYQSFSAINVVSTDQLTVTHKYQT
jgi:hypothetical protein